MSDDNCTNGGEDTRGGQAEFTLESDGGRVPVDELLECLANSRRRMILYHLQDEEIADLEDLSQQVIAQEEEMSPEEVPAEEAQTVQTQLIHRHLPKLQGARVIEFDQRSQTVRYSDPPRILDATLQVLAKFESN